MVLTCLGERTHLGRPVAFAYPLELGETFMRSNNQQNRILESLPEALDEIRQSAPRPRDDRLYRYLANVYALRLSLANKPKADVRSALNILAKTIHQRIAKNIIRLIIELSAPDHITSKMKGKYSGALNWALIQEVSAKKVKKFLHDQGGLNACVKKYSRHKKRG